MTRSRHSGRIESMLSSNNRVKSKPPRHCPAEGPNVSSTAGHAPGDMTGSSGRMLRGQGFTQRSFHDYPRRRRTTTQEKKRKSFSGPRSTADMTAHICKVPKSIECSDKLSRSAENSRARRMASDDLAARRGFGSWTAQWVLLNMPSISFEAWSWVNRVFPAHWIACGRTHTVCMRWVISGQPPLMQKPRTSCCVFGFSGFVHVVCVGEANAYIVAPDSQSWRRIGRLRPMGVTCPGVLHRVARGSTCGTSRVRVALPSPPKAPESPTGPQKRPIEVSEDLLLASSF